MPVGSSHDVANARDVVGWNVFVKEVAHRVHENLPWSSPLHEERWISSGASATLPPHHHRVTVHEPSNPARLTRDRLLVRVVSSER